jgi:comEA protein
MPARAENSFMLARAVSLPLVLVLLALLSVAARPAAAGGRDVDGVVNLNTASEEELRLLPGVGPAKASNIVAYRRAHPFRTVEELVRIKGIGRKMVRKLRLHLTISGPTTAKAVGGRPGTRTGPPRDCPCPAAEK